MRAVYNERTCEPGRYYARRWALGLGVLLFATTTAVAAEIVSDRHDGSSTGDASVEDYAPYSGERLEPTPLVDPLRWKRADLKRALTYAEERVWFDGSPETVATCNAAVAELAKVSIGKVTGQCKPPATLTSTAP